MQPEEIASRSFGGSFHGYDKAEVRRYLTEVSDEYKGVLARVADAEVRLDDLGAHLERLSGLLREADERYRAAQAHLAALESERDALVIACNDSYHDPADALGERVSEVLQKAVVAARSIRAEAESWAAHRRRHILPAEPV